MSLAAQIRIAPPHWLITGIVVVGGGGYALIVATLLARIQAGFDVGFGCALLVAISVVLGANIWRHWSFLQTLCFRTIQFKVLESGLIELEASFDDQWQAQENPPRYALALDSLYWPGLFVLRLYRFEGEHESTVVGPLRQPVVLTVVALKNNLSETSSRALTRLMLWAQRRGVRQGSMRTTHPSDPTKNLMPE